MKRTEHRIVPSFLFLLICILSVARVYIANSDSTQGDTLTKVISDIETIQHTNTLLTQKVASASALFALSAQARGAGFVHKTTFVTLNAPLPLALSKDTAL